jgi:hypothetical protein
MNWFKFYGQEFLTDLKIKQLSIGHQLAWVYVLCLASQNNGVIKYLDEHSLKGLMGLQVNDDNWTEIDGCLESFEALQMITISNKIVTVLRYGVRQTQNLSNAERQKKYRETHKIASNTVTNSNATQSNDSNARLDKIRIDKNRIERDNVSQNYLLNIPTDDLNEFTTSFQCSSSQVVSKGQSLYDWCLANGQKKKDNKAFLRNALRKDFTPRIIATNGLDVIKEKQRVYENELREFARGNEVKK